MRPRTVLAVVLLAGLCTAAGFGMYRAAHPAGRATLDERTRTVASGLRCPTCEAQSAADSPAPMAQDMRGVIRDQLAAGRTPEQVRAWFVERYGEEVLLDPAPTGAGLLVWAVPVVALVVGAGAIGVARRNGRHAARSDARSENEVVAAPRAEEPADLRRTWTFGRAAPVAALSVVAAALLVAVTVSLWSSPEKFSQGESATAVSNASPTSTSPVTAARRSAGTDSVEDALRREAASALRAGDPAQAQKSARSLLRVHPDDPDGLLLLGLAQRATDEVAAGNATLRRFLRVAPKHPAADSVRHLVASS